MATREVAMTYRCLLNPDVEIPDDMIAAHWEWCLACSGRLPVPGTLRYELVRFGAAVNTAQVEMLRLASAAVRRLVEGLRRLADRDVARPVEDGIRSVGGDN